MTFTVPEPAPDRDPQPNLEPEVTPEADPELEAEAEASMEHPATGSVKAIVPSRHLATQTEYPVRTAILHGGGIFLSFLLAVAAILGDGNVQTFINTYVPGQAAGVIAFGVFCGTVAGLLSRIANLTRVAAFRTRIGIGPVPKP